MSASSPTLCFTCGLATSEPPRLNQLPNGSNCPACRDRLLDGLPALLPGRPSLVMEQHYAGESMEGSQDWPSPPEEERL